jgi:hypothetical protein
MYKYIIILTILFIIAINSNAAIINVPGDYTKIQAAINASSNRDTILVEPNTYYENINFRGKNVVLTSRYYINNDLSFITSTIINGSNPLEPDTASCVIISSGEDSTSVLQGFTLTGGTGTLWLDEHGAGRYTEAGGILIQDSNPIIQNNIIKNNEAIRKPPGITSAGAGGIRIGDASPKIINNIIINNSGMYGGGIVSNYASPIIRNNLIIKNRVYQAVTGASTFGGGGIWVLGNGQRPLIDNNTIVGNSSSGSGSSAAGKGGGLLIWQTPVTAKNNIIWGNIQTTGDQVIVLGSPSLADITYCNVQGGWTGTGNINSEPMFDSTNYYLADGSPCIDHGDPDTSYNDLEDPNNPGFAKFPSKGSLRNDIGAYGGPLSRMIANMVVSIKNGGLNYFQKDYQLKQNYPNPFNPTTNINYFLPQRAYVLLEIFNLCGEHIETLMEGYQNAGDYNVAWNAGYLSTGVYFYVLNATEVMLKGKAILLK